MTDQVGSGEMRTRENRAKHFFQKSFRNDLNGEMQVIQQKWVFLAIPQNRVCYNGDTECVNTRLAV